MNAICRITDGTATGTVDFLKGVFRLNTWPPKIAQAKGGGTWQDSPLVEGRRLVARVRGNVVEEYDFQVVGDAEDVMDREVQNFRRLLEKAVNYWTTDWQDEPVWFEVRGECETNTRYAVIHDWSTPQDEDPFGTIFSHGIVPGSVVMANWLLLIERGQWRGDPPDGTNTCVQLSSGETWYESSTFSTQNNGGDPGANDCTVNHVARSIDLTGNILRVGVAANVSYSFGFRIQNITVPAGSHILYAAVRLVATGAAAGQQCLAMLYGESNNAPAIFTTYEDFVGRTRTAGARALGTFDAVAGGNWRFQVTQIVQEIVDLPSWSSGDDMVFFFEDNGSDNNAYRDFDSLENAGSALVSIYYASGSYTRGRAATCDNEVVLANKHNDARIDAIYYDDGGVWSGNLVNAALPTALLPAAPAAADAIYFGGAMQNRAKNGPFMNIVFDLSQGAGTAIGTWEFYNGAGWTAITEAGGTVHDETQLMTQTGVNGVFFARQDASAWVDEDLNTVLGGAAPAVTAFWLRFRITAAGGAPTAPTQQNRRIYTAGWPEAEFAAAQTSGDIQALSRVKLYNRSASGRFLSSGADANVLTPDLMANRAFVATRSVDRGNDFRLWINFVNGPYGAGNVEARGLSWHNPSGVTINRFNSDTNEVADTVSPLDQSTQFNPAAAVTLADRVEILMNGEIAEAYYGTFKCFLRLRQDGGSSGDFTFRVKVRTSTAGQIFQSQIFTLDPKTAAGADENLWLLYDVGRVDIVPPQLLASGDEMNNLSVVTELGNSNGTPGDLYLLDMGFLPIDEWACDCEDYSGSTAGALMSGLVSLRYLDVDSIGNARRKKRLLIRGDDTADSIQATWAYRSNGISSFQANSQQRIYAIFARYFESGGESFWDGNPDICSSIQAFTVPRYLAARGAR